MEKITNIGVDDNISADSGNVSSLLGTFAKTLQVDVSLLNSLGIRETKHEGSTVVSIPYKNNNGVIFARRFFIPNSSDMTMFQPVGWDKDPKSIPYGIWKHSEWKTEDSIYVTTSEADQIRLTAKGLPAIAIRDVEELEYLEDQCSIPPQRLVIVNHPEVFKEPPPGFLRHYIDRLKIIETGKKSVCDIMNEHNGSLTGWLSENACRVDPVTMGWEKPKEELIAELRAECAPLLASNNIEGDFRDALKRLGYVAEFEKAWLTYLVFSSRVFASPLSLMVSGTSSTGKSKLVKVVQQFMPMESYEYWSTMSDNGLSFLGESLCNKMLIINETDGISTKRQDYLLRTLLSEGELRHLSSRLVNGRREPIVTRTKVNTGVITTSTRIHFNEENITRMIQIQMSDDPEITRSIMLAEKEDGYTLPRTWVAFQELLALEQRDVVVPYSQVLMKKTSCQPVRMRRDKEKILNMIQIHALLHRTHRETDENGSVIANEDDYNAIYKLLNPILSEMAGVKIAPELKAVVAAVTKLEKSRENGTHKGVSQISIAKELDLLPYQVSRRVKKCIEKGYISDSGTRGPKNSRLLQSIPEQLDEFDILPAPLILFPEAQTTAKPKQRMTTRRIRETTLERKS